MKRYYILYTTCIAAFLLVLSSCWREDTDDCWKGDVILSVTAEAFQTAPDAPSEKDISTCVDNMQYYLFDNSTGKLAFQGNVEDVPGQTDHYDVVFHTLPFGTYTLALTANSGNLQKGIDSWKNLHVSCPAEADAHDCFVSLYSFTLDCECGYKDFVKLYRTNGVLEVQLKGLPENILRAEAEVNNISDTCLPDTAYQGNMSVKRSVDIVSPAEKQESVVTVSMDAFPTVKESASKVFLRLYMDDGVGGEILAYDQTLKEDVRIFRNQLTRVETDFEGDISKAPSVKVTINPEWDGVNDDTNVDFD